MTLLAYDPWRLTALGHRMEAAAHELRRVRCDDPSATDAIRAVRSTLDDLEITWLPLVRLIIETAPLAGTGRERSIIEQLDHSLAWVMSRGYGWSVAKDPLPDGGSIDVAEANALAVRMSAVDPTQVAGDRATIDWLVEQLRAIAVDPTLSRAFVANFHGWKGWGDALAHQRAFVMAGLASSDVDVATLDSLFEQFAHVQRAAGTHDMPWIDQMSPYAAAGFVRYLGLDAEDLVAVTDRLLQRDLAEPHLGAGWPPGPRAADLLYPVLLLDPAACARFTAVSLPHPASMFTTADDPQLAYRVALVGTSPDQLSIAQAGKVVLPLLQYFADEDPLLHAGTFLADLVVPWTFQFAPTVDDWPDSMDRRSQLFDFALSEDDALNLFIDRSDAVLAGVNRSIAENRARRYSQFGSYVGMIGAITVNRRVREVTRRRRAWDLVCNLAGVAASLIPGMIIGVAATLAVVAVQSHLGPDVNAEKHRAIWAQDLAQTTAAAAVLRVVEDSLKREGSIPQDFPLSPQVDVRSHEPAAAWWPYFSRWMDQLPGQWDGPIGNRVLATVYAMIGPYTIGNRIFDLMDRSVRT